MDCIVQMCAKRNRIGPLLKRPRRSRQPGLCGASAVPAGLYPDGDLYGSTEMPRPPRLVAQPLALATTMASPVTHHRTNAHPSEAHPSEQEKLSRPALPAPRQPRPALGRFELTRRGNRPSGGAPSRYGTPYQPVERRASRAIASRSDFGRRSCQVSVMNVTHASRVVSPKATVHPLGTAANAGHSEYCSS